MQTVIRTATAIGLGLALAAAAPAPAQFGEAAGFSEMMSPYFLRRDLHIFEEGLDLDEDQAAILESIFWDYEEEHNASRQKMLDQLQNVRQDIESKGRDEVLALVFQPFESRAHEWAAKRDGFLDDVKLVLNKDQLARWDQFRRLLRREKEIPQGRFEGEALDLFQIVRDADMSPAERDRAKAVLQDYEMRLDELLAKREALMHESRLAMMHSIRDDDPERAVSIYDEQIGARVRIRDLNTEFIDLVWTELGDTSGAAFRQLALERGYPRIYRPTAAQRLYEEALQLEGLTDEVRTAIDGYQSAFLAELTVVNENIVRLLREYEPEDARFRARSFAQRSLEEKPQRPADPTRPEFAKRDELGQRYADMLRNLLTDEQFRSLRSSQRFLRRTPQPGEPGVSVEPPPPGDGRAAKKRAMREEQERRNRGLGGGAGGPGGGSNE
jgi:hypothetical protein